MRPILADRTALVVVHRPSTVALADRAALLEDGRIVATGTHRDLLAREPRYAAILSQAAEEAETRPDDEGRAERMMLEPDEIPDVDADGPLDLTGDAHVDAWRGVAAEEVEEPSPGLAGLLRSRSRRCSGVVDATAPPARSRSRPRSSPSTPPAQLAGPWLVHGRHRQRHPAAARRWERQASGRSRSSSSPSSWSRSSAR